MNPKTVLCAVSFAVVSALVWPAAALADDGASSIAAGGLVPRRETRIVMAKEVLRIGETKVVVDYDFRNDSVEDVTTEVAFQIPPYENGFPYDDISGQSFQSFHLWVNGMPLHYQSQATATLNGKDVTDVLRANHIDVATFGHFTEVEDSNHVSQPISADLSRLPKSERDNLLKEGLFAVEGSDYPQLGLWTVHLQYHWTQTFRAHSTVHIRHEYTPVVGFNSVSLGAIKLALQPTYQTKRPVSEFSDELKQIGSFCPDEPFLRGAKGLAPAGGQNSDDDDGIAAELSYVDFILTTANTWKRPIEDFTLIVERPAPGQNGKVLVSFCSPANGKVEKLDEDHFQVHLNNLIPASELHIGFFETYPPFDYSASKSSSAKSTSPVIRRWGTVKIASLIVGGILVLLMVFDLSRRRLQAIKSQEKPRD